MKNVATEIFNEWASHPLTEFLRDDIRELEDQALNGCAEAVKRGDHARAAALAGMRDLCAIVLSRLQLREPPQPDHDDEMGEGIDPALDPEA